jgi:hypothetical protein
MRDGTFTYYTLQHRRTHESPWLKPRGKLKPVKELDDWSFSSWDVFGGTAEPWVGTGNNYKPQFKEAHDETHSVWACTGRHGWWSLKYAVKGLRRVQAAQARGKFDSRGTYGSHNQALRYEFRLVKVTVSKVTEEVSSDDLMEALVA